jgi:general secretion pathway protein M
MRLDLAAMRPVILLRWRARILGAAKPERGTEARAAATQWWNDRTSRERWLLGILAAVAIVVGLDRLVWHPLDAARTAALAEIARDDRIAVQLRVAGPDVARIAAARTGTLSTLVTDRAAKAGLTIARIEPQGANVAVSLDGVGFDALIDWLAALDRDAGVTVVDLKVDRRPDPGVVTAQVTLTER